MDMAKFAFNRAPGDTAFVYAGVFGTIHSVILRFLLTPCLRADIGHPVVLRAILTARIPLLCAPGVKTGVVITELPLRNGLFITFRLVAGYFGLGGRPGLKDIEKRAVQGTENDAENENYDGKSALGAALFPDVTGAVGFDQGSARLNQAA